MSWNQTAAAAPPPAQVSGGAGDVREILDRWAGQVETAPGFLAEGESEADRRDRLRDLTAATLSMTVCGDVEATISVDLPCEVLEEQSGDHLHHVEGEPEALTWLVVRVEAFEPVALGSATLTSLSVAIPGHVGPGLYQLDELRRRAERDEVAWWEVDDFHLSPSPHGDESTYYLEDEALDGAWVATTGASVAFDLPMSSVVSEIRVTGTITWAEPGDRPQALVQTTFGR